MLRKPVAISVLSAIQFHNAEGPPLEGVAAVAESPVCASRTVRSSAAYLSPDAFAALRGFIRNPGGPGICLRS